MFLSYLWCDVIRIIPIIILVILTNFITYKRNTGAVNHKNKSQEDKGYLMFVLHIQHFLIATLQVSSENYSR